MMYVVVGAPTPLETVVGDWLKCLKKLHGYMAITMRTNVIHINSIPLFITFTQTQKFLILITEIDKYIPT